MKYLRKQQTGSVLLAIVLMLPFLILILSLYTQFSTSSLQLAKRDQFHTHAQLATDAGLDYGIQQIANNATWAGTGSEVELYNDGAVRTTYQVTVTDTDATHKAMASTGRTYRPANSSTPSSSVTVTADLRAVTAGLYSVVTGVGGLILSNSAKIVGGDVLVNGEITMSNSSQIGLSSTPVNVEVAHQNCPEPANATYPRLCNSGENGQPITINNSAHIYGNVKANNQTSGSGMTNPGLTASSGVSVQALPPHDRDAQKAAITTTISGSTASCSGSQTRTWQAGTKITGDVTVKNSCTVTVLGDVWITGKLEVENSSQLIVSDSLGATRPNIMIDHKDGAFIKNSALLRSNSVNTGFQVITYYSQASCSPDCGNVSGTDLYNTRNETTISLDNSASGPNTIFYARWSRVLISNSGQIGALVGQTVELKNSGTITFGTSTGVGNTYWVFDGYRRTFN